jgi:signal transduction histidine kinase
VDPQRIEEAPRTDAGANAPVGGPAGFSPNPAEGGAEARAATTTTAVAWLRSALVRGESAIAPIGITLAAIFLGTMAAAGWWTLRTQKAASETARAEQVTAVANLLAHSVEPLLAQDELSAVRRLVAEAGHSYGLSRCRIVLPEGQVVADADAPKTATPHLPPTWPTIRIPPEGAAATAEPGTVDLVLPLKVAGRGSAELQVAATVSHPFWTYWETQTGMGTIGAFSMIALLLVYRRMRSRLRAVGAIREALLAARGGQSPASNLVLSPALGPEAQSWNDLMGEIERARKQGTVERVRDSLGRRRQAKGDLDAACDAMSQGLLLVDERARVKYANGAAATFLRADRALLVGAEVDHFLQVPKVLEAVREIAAGNLRRRVVIDVEQSQDPAATTSARPNGSRSGPVAGDDAPAAGVLRFSIRPVRREDTASAMVIIDDVTQQKAAEEARHAFVAQATHELRTPLTNIRLYVETAIEEGEKDPATRARCLNVINGEARRLERIVGEMLSVAEIEAGSFKVAHDDIRLDAMFEELKADFVQQASDKQMRLTFALPPKLPVIKGDRDKVMLALHNLVGNALKYTPAGGSVVVDIRTEDGHLSVAVKDTGIGINPEDHDRIFERFYRARDERVAKITGSGLGLTLAREVARLHGGDITVESVLNHGSTFTLTLPLKTEAA